MHALDGAQHPGRPIAGDATFQSPHPELQNPENYYTCRYDFVPQATLDALGSPGGAAAQLHVRRR